METVFATEARKILGDEAGRYTNSQLEEIINTFTAIADLAIDDSLKKRCLANTVVRNPVTTKERDYEQN